MYDSVYGSHEHASNWYELESYGLNACIDIWRTGITAPCWKKSWYGRPDLYIYYNRFKM
jgi:hypothetical protein